MGDPTIPTTSRLRSSLGYPQQHPPLYATMSPLLRLLAHLCRLSHSHEASPLRSAQYEESKIHSCLADALVQLESPSSEIDPSPMADSSTPPEHLVDAIRRLGPFLPIGCEVFGLGDLEVVGSHPIDAGGFADVWAGERNDGTVVAIKSPRCHSLSSCLPAYSVSHE